MLFLELMWAHLCVLIIKKGILILGKGPTKGIDGTTITAEAEYPINFTQSGKRFVLSLHYKRSNSFCLWMLQKYISLKQKTQK